MLTTRRHSRFGAESGFEVTFYILASNRIYPVKLPLLIEFNRGQLRWFRAGAAVIIIGA